jgi:hypothetical protein
MSANCRHIIGVTEDYENGGYFLLYQSDNYDFVENDDNSCKFNFCPKCGFDLTKGD